ncbi:MAG: flagellar hook assembly protein FlgD [Deltaproteobacteria bacterium]|nr:flagellar hook assembly protein FlgD [Deltaproteobacteria bacterium]MBW2338811.1 flagellar hook assembly protein FlgD [Deltaproteobacteria bacterium]
MIIDQLGETSAEASSYVNPKNNLGRDEFLTLLVTQLKNQDPLNPMESADFTAQLAQFSSLEQLFGMNKTLADIQDTMRAQESGNVLDYIGKLVKTHDNTIFVKDGNMDSNTYTLEDGAEVAISIYDIEGVEVRRIYAGRKEAGEHDLSWDGRDNSGNLVGNGVYSFEVEATDENGFVVPYDTYLTGEVTGVTYQNTTPYLMIGNKLVAPENVLEVRKNNSQ